MSSHTLTELSRPLAEALGQHQGEPDWMRQRRLEAWALFEELPMPTTREELWRRTDLRDLKLDAMQLVSEQAWRTIKREEDLPAPVRALLTDGDSVAGLVVHQNGGIIYQALPEELTRQGVIFTDLARAGREWPDLVQPHFQTDGLVKSLGKFSALHAAFWSGGVLLYVPEGVVLEKPVQTCFFVDQPGLASFPHVVVIAGANSQFTYVEQYISAPPVIARPAPSAVEGAKPEAIPSNSEEQSMAGAQVEMFLGPGANMNYCSLQQWERNFWEFSTKRATLQRDSHLTEFVGTLGSRLTKMCVETVLAGPGASTEMLGLFFAQTGQHLEHLTLQDHVVGDSTSDLLFKGVLKGQSRSVFTGKIAVHPDAQRTNAYQANRNLVLSDKARADSIPILEIEAHEVRCTHGATVGQLDESQLFYLMSRGLSRPAAERLIVAGFFEPVLRQIPLASLRASLERAIEAKITEPY